MVVENYLLWKVLMQMGEKAISGASVARIFCLRVDSAFTIFQEAKTADSDKVLGIDLTSEGDEPLD